MTLSPRICATTSHADLIPGMQALGFDCVFDHSMAHPQASSSHMHLFVHPKVGISEITRDVLGQCHIRMHVNTIPLKPNHSHIDCGSWLSTYGKPSGYGSSIQVASLVLKSQFDLGQLVDELKSHFTLICPMEESLFRVNASVFKKEVQPGAGSEKGEKVEKDKQDESYHKVDDTRAFLDQHIDPRYHEFFGKPRQNYDANMILWNDLIRWSLKPGTMPEADKSFYGVCKSLLSSQADEFHPAFHKSLDTNDLTAQQFFSHTSQLGHNFAHLMSAMNDPVKKQWLWEQFNELPRDQQAALFNQSDGMGYNPVLLLAQKAMYDDPLNHDYFKRYLTIEGVERAFVNSKNSLLDCLNPSASTLRPREVPYLNAMAATTMQIPMHFHVKVYPWSHAQCVDRTLQGAEVANHVSSDIYQYIKAHNLSKTLNQTLSQPKEIKVKRSKI